MYLFFLSVDKAEVSIQGTVKNDARYFELSDAATNISAKTMIVHDSDSELFDN